MLEHLDDPLQPPNSAVDPEFADVRERAAQRRRSQGAVAGVVVFSVLVTGGVSGLALGGPDVVHAPIGAGALLAIGDPRSVAQHLDPANLLASERVSPNACPSLASAGRPTSAAAVAVAVTHAVVLPSGSVRGDLGQVAGDATTPLQQSADTPAAPSAGIAPPSHAAAPGAARGPARTGGSSSGGSGGSGGSGSGGPTAPPVVVVPPPPVIVPPAPPHPPVDPPPVVVLPPDPGPTVGTPAGDTSTPSTGTDIASVGP